MVSTPASTSETSGHSSAGGGIGVAATVGAVGTAVTGVASLPQVFEQYPQGAATVVGLVVFIGAVIIAVTWIKYRR
jgi:uncharacterized protein with PQ loop repeat